MPMPAAMASPGCRNRRRLVAHLDDRRLASCAEQAADHPIGPAAEQSGETDDLARAQAHRRGAVGPRLQQQLTRWDRRGDDVLGDTAGHGGDEIVHGEGAAFAHGRNRAVAQHGAAVGDRDHLVETVGDVDDGGAARLHAREHGEQPLDLALFQRRGRLVEHEDAAAPAQRFGDGDELALGETERGHAPVRIGSKIELGEHRACLVPHAGAIDQHDGAKPPHRQIAERDVLGNRSAGTSRSSCGMVTMPAAIASCGLAKWQGLPSTKMAPRSGRCTPPRMRIRVDCLRRSRRRGRGLAEGDVEVDAGKRERRAEFLGEPSRRAAGWVMRNPLRRHSGAPRQRRALN